jgi:glycosyltransferase involved in cell wall biosynthesis
LFAWWRLPRTKEFGVNVIGFVDGEFGLGVMARSLLTQLEAAGIPYRIIANEVRYHGFAKGTHHTRSIHCNFGVNIAVSTPDRWHLDALRLFAEVDLRLPTIGYLAWELEAVPQRFLQTLKLFDSIWGISKFCAINLSKSLNQAPNRLPIVINPPALTKPIDPIAFGLKLDKNKSYFKVGYFFDSASFVERKNPLDLLKAFQIAFPITETLKVQPILILKTHNTHLIHGKTQWDEVVSTAAKDWRVTVVDKKLDAQLAWSLLNYLDCYASLHRTEGLGLTIGEALSLNKPTICTSYGGVTDYSDQDGFYGVGYSLIPIQTNQYVGISEGLSANWAQPDIGNAAHLLRQVYESSRQ